jgi:hypothetical protein
VAHLRFGGAVNRLDRGSARVPVIRTPAGLLRRLGRTLLWLLVVVLLLRGLAGLVSPGEPRAVVRAAPHAVVAWPDDEARAFAADFARAYLGYSPKDAEAYTQTLERFVAPELVASIAPEFQEDEPRQAVGAVTVARTASLDASHALVTVAAAVNGRTRYLAVPVARDSHGGLVVADLPSLVAPPARGVVDAPELEPVAAGERAGIVDVLSRFFGFYLAGDAKALEYLVAAGVRMGALGQRYELDGLMSLALAAPARGRVREVWATVRARDAATRAVYPLRYRLRLVRGERWQVAAVNSSTKGG